MRPAQIPAPSQKASPSARESPLLRIASLDGWRAISIVLVLVSHAVYTNGFPPAGLGSWSLLFDGDLGVRIFFILSGFIITHLLCQEALHRGDVSLLRFFARRALRILPVYLAYLLVLALFTAAGWYRDSASSWLGSLTFTRNMVGRGDSATVHCWSLAVEEQFYLLWPLLFSSAALWKNPRRALCLLAGIALACASLRMFVPAVTATGTDFASRLVGPRSLARYADALALGCAVALLLPHGLNDRLRRGLPALGWLGLFGVVVLGQWIMHTPGWPEPVRGLVPLVQGAALSLLILASTHTAAGKLHTVLNHPAAVTAGTLSYSLYLWHFLFLGAFLGPLWPDLPTHNWKVWWIGAILVSAVSYYALERPLLRFRKALARA